jgi:hypothetical protein
MATPSVPTINVAKAVDKAHEGKALKCGGKHVGGMAAPRCLQYLCCPA